MNRLNVLLLGIVLGGCGSVEENKTIEQDTLGLTGYAFVPSADKKSQWTTKGSGGNCSTGHWCLLRDSSNSSYVENNAVNNLDEYYVNNITNSGFGIPVGCWLNDINLTPTAFRSFGSVNGQFSTFMTINGYNQGNSLPYTVPGTTPTVMGTAWWTPSPMPVTAFPDNHDIIITAGINSLSTSAAISELSGQAYYACLTASSISLNSSIVYEPLQCCDHTTCCQPGGGGRIINLQIADTDQNLNSPQWTNYLIERSSNNGTSWVTAGHMTTHCAPGFSICGWNDGSPGPSPQAGIIYRVWACNASTCIPPTGSIVFPGADAPGYFTASGFGPYQASWYNNSTDATEIDIFQDPTNNRTTCANAVYDLQHPLVVVAGNATSATIPILGGPGRCLVVRAKRPNASWTPIINNRDIGLAGNVALFL